MDYQAIEEMLQAKGLKAPRVTPTLIDSVIKSEAYYVFPGTHITVCCLTLQNGFSVVGESARVSAADFDAEIGRTVARAHARDKVWLLEGYLLKQYMSALLDHFGEPPPA